MATKIIRGRPIPDSLDEYWFSAGGMVYRCGRTDPDTLRMMAVVNDAQFAEWRKENPDIVSWKTHDGRRVN